MSQNDTLETLRELAAKELENAARRLGEMRQGLQLAGEQLSMLMNYQQEYRDNLNNTMSTGIASNRWQNYQQFIQTLDTAIDQHQQQLDQWTIKVDKALGEWKEKQQRLQAWQTLQERKESEARREENRLDQKRMDEFAQRATHRKDK